MAPLGLDREIFENFQALLKKKCPHFSSQDFSTIVDLIHEEILYRYVDRLISQVEGILEINPSLEEREILKSLARSVAGYLDAQAATIRLYDPGKKAMISFGVYPESAHVIAEAIPFENTIPGEVVKTRQSTIVPDLLKEERYVNKNKVEALGIRSMLAVPFSLPRYSLKDSDTEGAIQIYYGERDRQFTPLEIKIAEVLSKRVSYVIARKRIMDLQKINVTKDKIVEKIFLKLGRKEGVKMKEVFDLVIPEMVDIMRIQRSSLFSIREDRDEAVLEAGYPEAEHGIGKVFPLSEPYIDAVVNQAGPFGEFENEKIDPDYILIKNPRGSRLLPAPLKQFLDRKKIDLVLYVPLKVNDVVKYFLVFDAQAQDQRFGSEEIEIFTFLGKELMKGLRLEKMDDTLHDFKNPAIAACGFVKRVKKMLRDEKSLSRREKIEETLDIIEEETLYLQNLALSLHGGGREETVDLASKLKRRFLVNEEAMKELERENVRLVERELQGPLWVRCYPIHVERVLDNLLMNAANAIPRDGGELSVRCYRQDSWAIAEITNTGEISEEEKNRVFVGDTRGRGLHTVSRLVKEMGGKMEVETGEGRSTFRILLPLVTP